MFIDWRGRMYTYTKNLSFQSNEFARSMIMFKEGSKLNSQGLESLKIYIANCYGLDKLKYTDRLN